MVKNAYFFSTSGLDLHGFEKLTLLSAPTSSHHRVRQKDGNRQKPEPFQQWNLLTIIS